MTAAARAVALLAPLVLGCSDRDSTGVEDPNRVLEDVARLLDSGEHGRALSTLEDLFARLLREPVGGDRVVLRREPLKAVLCRLLDMDEDGVPYELVLQCALSYHAAAGEEAERFLASRVEAGDGGAPSYFDLLALAHVVAPEDPKRSVELFRRASASRPESPEAAFFLSFALLSAGRLPEALRETDRAIALGFHDRPRADYQRGVILERLGRLAEALESLEELGRGASPFAGRAWNEVGKIRARAGDLDGAEQAFRLAVERDPERVAPRYNLARMLFDRGEFDEAESHLDRCAAHGSDRARLLLGRIAEERGDAGAAERLYREAARGEPDVAARARRHLAALLRRQGRDAEAARLDSPDGPADPGGSPN